MAHTKPTIIPCGRYTLQKLPAIPFLFETHAATFKISFLITWILWTLYIAFQYTLAIRFQYAQQRLFVWQLWTAIISEMLLDFAPAVLAFSIALGLFNVPEAGPRPRYSLRGDRAPEIDVLVTCCGEAVEVIRNTVIAAATQDYPLDRLQVYALDDGKNADLCCAIDRVNHTLASRNIKSAPIVYLSRELKPGENSNFKSGNLRFGIKESKARFRDRKNGYISHDECLDSFVAALDADMIPEKNWLKSIVPHLLLDGNLGLACPPQKYYNVPEDPSDTLGQHTDFDIYFSVQEALNDRLGAAMCTGSGYVARRSAVESIGGWPLADCGEDYMCSAMLSDGGWGIAHVSSA